MQVILLERIERLGDMGDEVVVKPGYARNYLLPRKKALRATDDNRVLFESRRGELEEANRKRRDEALGIAGGMDGLTLILIRQAGDTGQLYGSVSARDIIADLGAAGFKVERGQVQLDHPIKELGLYEVRVVLHAEVTETITVNVARTEEEAAAQVEHAAADAAAEALEAATDDSSAAEAPAEAESAAEPGEEPAEPGDAPEGEAEGDDQ
jgi:large subunit ribosomal protein L9